MTPLFTSISVQFALKILLLCALLTLLWLSLYSDGSYLSVRQSPLYTWLRPRVAVCLAGGLRDFELTAPSIVRYVLSQSPGHLDVFVVTPLDENSWKVYLLESTNVVAVRIAPQGRIPENNITEIGIRVRASPKGRQGLLKYLELSEACADLIIEYEISTAQRYTHILRTRPDTLWASAPPHLTSVDSSWGRLAPGRLHIPPGSDWYGLNDRLAFGPRDESLVAMRWLSTLPRQVALGHINLSSEEKFLRLVEMEGLGRLVTRTEFPFCVITHRSFKPPNKHDPGRHGPQVVPVGESLAKNGIYCCPCKPTTDPLFVRPVFVEFFNSSVFCDMRNGTWVPEWPALFDRAVGPTLAAERIRFVEERNRTSCSSRVTRFLGTVALKEHTGSGEELCAAGFGRKGKKGRGREGGVKKREGRSKKARIG